MEKEIIKRFEDSIIEYVRIERNCTSIIREGNCDYSIYEKRRACRRAIRQIKKIIKKHE